MPDSTNPDPHLTRIASEASALQHALRRGPTDRASVLATRINDAQQLASTAVRLFLTLGAQASPPTPADLLHLHQVAQIAKAAQDAAAELAAALARGVENQRRADTASGRVVLIGPTPQQFIASAADLLDPISALCHVMSRDRQ
ncbi:hypothetical protein ACWC6I_41250 [Streptomyces sp. NPDC001414]